jgi:oligopeptidase B
VDSPGGTEYVTSTIRVHYGSLVTPDSVYDYDLNSRELTLLKTTPVLDEPNFGPYDRSNYIQERAWATAPDGVRVPLSIVRRSDIALDGQAPTLLYGYGSYEISLDPTFSMARLSLLDRGVIYALAHVRGGGELGRSWYEQGKTLSKKNSFTDFIACAEHLIKEGFTSNKKLAILGGSAGGLLVSACLTMRPDLFQAVINKVAFVDVVTTMSDPTIPLTSLEWDEWGNPQVREHFEYMLSYSPYDNVRPTAYPHILITTGLNDPRVAYWEPAKFAAKLREMKTDSNVLLLHTNYDAGHAGASGRYDYLKEVAIDFAFLIDRLCEPQSPLEYPDLTGI